MNPGIDDLIALWLDEVNSEWKHTKSIRWKSDAGDGEATNPYGFLVHPLSLDFGEIVWLGGDTVGSMFDQKPIAYADPQFFERLELMLSDIVEYFKQNPNRKIGFGAGLYACK